MKRRPLTGLLCLLGALVPVAPAAALWTAGGSGVGSATTATMPTGATPTATVSARSVTVSFAQNDFGGDRLGSRSGGGYTVLRSAEGSSTAVTPGAGCAGTISGTSATLSCTEANVPYGRWVYRITPVLTTFTGTQGPPSAVAVVELAAPNLTAVTPANPGAAATNGPIAVTWDAVTGATGYNLYRRVAGGTFDYAAPLNGATPLTARTFSDTTATGGQTYDYVVRAVDGATGSMSSNVLSGRVVTRPPAPATATASTGAPAVTVSWSTVATAAGYDVYRRTSAGSFDYAAPLNGATPVTTTTFKDTTAASGTTYVYGIRAVVAGVNDVQVESLATTSTANASCASSYASTISAGSPAGYFRFADTSALAAANTANALTPGAYNGGVTLGAAGALTCDTNAAITLNGSTGYVSSGVTTPAAAGPNVFTVELWFKTTVGGGKLIGYGTARTGTSTQYDRHMYLTDGGQLVFGVYPNTVKVVTSPAEYDDGKWHMAVASLGAAGMRLYVDGAEVVADAATKTGEAYSGYWRVGYDNLNSWTAQPANPYFTGSVDEAAIFTSQLPASTVAAQYAAGRP